MVKVMTVWEWPKINTYKKRWVLTNAGILRDSNPHRGLAKSMRYKRCAVTQTHSYFYCKPEAELEFETVRDGLNWTAEIKEEDNRKSAAGEEAILNRCAKKSGYG
jgi:hypothetical protein